MTLVARPLTPEAFKPYGQVLMGFGEGPERHEFAAVIDNRREDAKPNMTFIRGAVADPSAVVVAAMERHVHSNQMFVPLNGTHYLVAVCPSTPAGDPDLDRLEAFVAGPSQAVNFDADVWHAPNTTLSVPGEFIMLRYDLGDAEDTEKRGLAEPVAVDLAGLVPDAGPVRALDTY